MLNSRVPPAVAERVYQAVGQASMCWSHIDSAGVFDASKASAIAKELCDFLGDIFAVPLEVPDIRKATDPHPAGYGLPND